MEHAGDGRRTRHQGDLPAPETIGAEAGRRAVARLGAHKLESRTAAVIFENRLAASLLSPLVGAIAGPAVARGNSFLKDRLGQAVFAPNIDIIDDPHRPRGLGSSPYDDEGVANQRRAIIDRGVLTTWLLNASSARQLGLETTGDASRGLAGAPGVSPTNLHLAPGSEDLAGLMRQADRACWSPRCSGPRSTPTPATGRRASPASGSRTARSPTRSPRSPSPATDRHLARLIPGSDLEFRGATNAPSIWSTAWRSPADEPARRPGRYSARRRWKPAASRSSSGKRG